MTSSAPSDQQVNAAAVQAAFQTHHGWQHQGYYGNGYHAGSSLHHQDMSLSYQFPGYLTANQWNAIPAARKPEENAHHQANTWSSSAAGESYPFFASSHQHQLHQQSAGSAFSAATNNANLINPHSPSEPKSGYPYYQHQMISGMEASHMLHCAGLVH